MSARDQSTTPVPNTGTNDGVSEPRCPSARSADGGGVRSEPGAVPTSDQCSASVGLKTVPSTGGTAPSRPSAVRSFAATAAAPSGEGKARCLCGKWWAMCEGDALVLRCKLCRREIVVRGTNLRIEYR